MLQWMLWICFWDKNFLSILLVEDHYSGDVHWAMWQVGSSDLEEPTAQYLWG
jgi:hypothetical protein